MATLLLHPRVGARKARRGAAVFVVMLVVTMLAAVGVFAARSSQMSLSSAGRYRQMVQTHYVSEMGTYTAISEVNRDSAAYVQRLLYAPAPTRPCRNSTLASPKCLRMAYEGLEQGIDDEKGMAGAFVLVPRVDNSGPVPRPGGLGMGDVQPNFGIELTDLTTTPERPPGFSLGSSVTSGMEFFRITVRTTGQIIPDGSVLDVNDVRKFSASSEETYAHIVVGPVTP